jgi:nicotinamidase-related amidase
MTRALLLIDVQNEYFAEGKLALPGIEATLEPIKILIEHFRTSHAPVVFVQHVGLNPDPEAPFAVGTSGADLHETLERGPLDMLIAKSFPNAFFQSWLETALRSNGITELVIAGAMTQTCIDSTARSALDFGYPVTIASDACAAGPLEWEGKAIPVTQVQKTFLAALATLMPVKKVADIVAPPQEAETSD